MPGPKRKVVTTEIIDPSDTETEIQQEGPIALEDSEGLTEYLGQFGPAPFKVKVYKLGPEGAAYCFQGGKEVDEEKIRNYGGGNYELRVFLNGMKQDTIHINIAEKPVTMLGQHEVVNPRENGGSLEMRLMREQLDFLKNMVLNGSRNTTPMSELVDAMKAMQTLGGGVGVSGGVDMLMKGIDLAKEIGAGGGGSSDWKTAVVDSLREVAKSLAPIVMARTTGAIPQTAGELPMSVDDMLKQGIATLKQKAISGMPPALVIDWVMYNAQDPQYQPFIQMVMQREFDSFVQLDGEIAQEPYLTWFRTLHSGLRDAFNSNFVESDVSESGSDGNVGDTKGNGSTGKARKSKQ